MPALAPPVHAEPEDLGEVLIDTGRIIEQTQYRMITTAAAFASSDQWIRAGYRTAAHWISDHVGVCVSTAREWIRVGRKLIEMPELDRAFASRALTYSKVRTLTRIATPGTAQELVDLAVMTPSDYLHHALAEWSKRNEDDDTRAARHHRERRLTYRVEPDGMIAGRFLLAPEQGGIVMAAIDAMLMRRRAISIADGGTSAQTEPFPSVAQQRADALVAVARGNDESMVTELVVHVRGDGCSLDDGTPLTDSVVASMIPRAHLRALIHDADGQALNASGRRRPTVRQKRVVKERHRRCVDCGSHDLLEYDHNPPFELTGRTHVDELELRCAPCHRARHAGDAA